MFKEIETKYNAKHIKLNDFISLCKKLEPVDDKQVSSYDYYYEKKKNEFIRYRAGTKPELTLKKKTTSKNNFIRTEINLPLDQKTSDNKRFKIVEAFCNQLKFYHNFTIYKTCYIYYYEKFNLVYYIAYDENLKEKRRLIEIEMDEEYPWPDEVSAWTELLKIEKKLSVLGINRKDRILKSLYEMFRKKNNG